jgi:SAM-dependent methyltransferase
LNAVREQSRYDRAAAGFNRRRALPDGVPDAIRAAVLQALAPTRAPAILDLGAGAGRIGQAFIAADDDYTGIDLSAAMLAAFRAASPSARLIRADGANLPFADTSFDAVLMVQVLNSALDWRVLLDEARRVLRPFGLLMLGRTVSSQDGLDARLKQRLSEILAAMGHDPYRSAANDDAEEWLDTATDAAAPRTVAAWRTGRSPEQFIERHSTGARFSGLPADVRAAALRTLRHWVEKEIGPLDTVFTETQQFTLRACRFRQTISP